MVLLGYHTSINGGYYKAAERAREFGLDTFQLFLSSPRAWAYGEIDDEQIELFQKICKKYGYKVTTVHMKYLANPSTPDKAVQLRARTIDALKTEVTRCDFLGITNLVMHLGSHKGAGIEAATSQIVSALNELSSLAPKVKILLENSAGGTNSVGSSFGELSTILHKVNHKDDFGICFDTCHAFAAGYDLRSPESVDQTLEQFDDIIGIKELRAIHLNDSKGGFNEGKDRHENIDKGSIGKEGLFYLLKHDTIRQSNIPAILETPGKGVESDIQLMREVIPLKEKAN